MTRLLSELSTCPDLLTLVQLLLEESEGGRVEGTPLMEEQFLLADELEQSARHLLGGAKSQGRVLSAARWARLGEIARGAGRRGLPEPLLAASLLQAVDGTVGKYLPELFEARHRGGRKCLQPGEAFPIAARDPRILLQVSRLSARPSAMQRPRHRWTNFGCLQLAKRSRFEVVIDYSAETALSRFLENPTVAAILPNLRFEKEFALTTDPVRRRFFDVTPRLPEEELFETLVHSLEQAAAAGASLVLLPELSITAPLSQRLHRWLEGQDALSVLVAGSFHQRTSEGRWNRSVTCAAGASVPLVHDKFNPYELGEWEGERQDPPLREDLVPATERLTVYWSRGWSFATLICKDFLDDEAMDLLLQLRPNLVFVVALSENSEAFVNRARALVARGQTLTFLCNFAGQVGTDALGVAAVVPLPRSPVRGAVQTQPSVFLLDLSDGSSMGWEAL